MKHSLGELNSQLKQKEDRSKAIVDEIAKAENLIRSMGMNAPIGVCFVTKWHIRNLEKEKEEVEEDIERINRLIFEVERKLERYREEFDNLKKLNNEMTSLRNQQQTKIGEVYDAIDEAGEDLSNAKANALGGIILGIIGACTGGIATLGGIAVVGMQAWIVDDFIEDADDELQKAENLKQDFCALKDQAEGLQAIIDEFKEKTLRPCTVCKSKYPIDEMVEFVGGGYICEECQDGECDRCGMGYSTEIGGTPVFEVNAGSSDCEICQENEGFYHNEPDLESLNHYGCQCSVEEMELCPKCLSKIDFKD